MTPMITSEVGKLSVTSKLKTMILKMLEVNESNRPDWKELRYNLG
jgi:hypothetical protein